MIMEHGKMSLIDALKIGLSFIKMYRQSPGFDYMSKRIENEDKFKTNVIERLDSVIRVSQSRR